MPRVLRIINRLNLGGPTFNAAYLSHYMNPEFETMLVAGMIDDSEASSEFITHEMGLKPVYIPEMYREIDVLKDRKAYKKIKNLIEDFKPDIVHTHAAKAGTLGRLAASAAKVPVILHTFHGHVFHSYFSPAKTRVFLEIERYLAKKSSRIIAISERQKKELSLLYKVTAPENIEVVPLGFDLEKFYTNQDLKRLAFRKKYLLNDNEIAISIIGRLVPVKNHQLFLKAVQAASKVTTKQLRFFIVGDGEERENLIQLSKNLDINYTFFPENQTRAMLTFTSWIKDVDEVMAGSDIIALCSLNEGTPVSLIEAQASNKPIITTRVGGIQDVVLKNETALISSIKNEDAFIKNLIRVVEDDLLREQLGQKGRQHVVDLFSFKRLVTDMSKLYYKLLYESGNK